jgi:Flp pilus assembly protein TadG
MGWYRRRRRGQAIVIMALAMVAICGMLALAIDAGRLYFQRRLMQDAVDAGALAGAQDLVGTLANPNGLPNQALYHALQDTFSVFNLAPAYSNPNAAPYTPAPPGNTLTDTEGSYAVTVVAPSGYNSKQVQVSVSYNAVATFAQVLGFNSINIQATATAEAGTNAKTYAIFAYGPPGTGNTITIANGGMYGQVDNGQDGNDYCNTGSAGVSISNAKFHIPAGWTGWLNINGNIIINQGSDNQHLEQYWLGAPPFGTGQDAMPNYQAADTSQITTINPAWVKITKVAANGSATVPGAPGVTLHNPTGTAHDFYVFFPGKYTNPVTVPVGGADTDSRYVFLNGLYYFTGGGQLTTTGGWISNTSTGLPHYVNGLGATDLPPAADGTDGVMFLLDGTSAFTSSNSSTASSLGPSLFFVAPSYVPTGSVHVAFYVMATDTAATSWSNAGWDASASNAPRFQVWGTVFDATAGHSSTYLKGVQIGPHNLNPTDADSSGQYAINGEFIGYIMTLDNGNVLGNGPGATPTCPGPVWSNRGTPALMVIFNKNFAPAPGVNSSLIK